MGLYYLEFILSTHNTTLEFIRNSLAELGEGLEVTKLERGSDEKTEDFQVHISALDPTVVFDTCAQIGRIRSVKAEERSA